MTEAAQLIADGKVGEVRYVTCNMGTFTYDLFGGHGLKEAANHICPAQQVNLGGSRYAGVDTDGDN